MKKEKTPNTKTTVPFYRSIKTRLVLSFLIPIVCIFALGIISYQKAASAIVDNYKQATEQTTDMIGQYIDLLLTDEKNDFKSYIGADNMIIYVRQLADANTLSPIRTDYLVELRSKINQDGNLGNVYFLLDDGRSIAEDTVYLPENAYSAYKETAQGASVTADGYSWFLFGQDAQTDAALNLDTSGYSLRIARRLNTLSCVMIIDISCNSLRNTLSSLDPGENGYVALITDAGSEFYSDKSVNAENPLIYGTDFYEAAVNSASLSGNQIVSIAGEKYLFVYDRSNDYGYMIAALIPEDEMLAGTKDIQTASVVMVLISIVIALILGTLLSHRISGTIRYILQQLARVSEGDLTVHMSTKNRDEFGLLCDGINDTVEHVKDLIVNVNEVSGQLTDAAAYVSETSGMFLETSQDIQKAVAEINIGVSRLDTGSEDCMNQMDSLSGKISNVSRNTDEIEKLTATTGDTILSGIDSVQGLTESAESTTAITQSVLAAIQELEIKSRSIKDITSAINHIAKQTKMLSLNATIEAAHAGNAGRGFAVVAAEIRGLSDQCLGSADQIASIVNEIEEQTQDVVKIAGQAEKVVSMQTDVVEETTESFHQIDRQVGFLLEALATISFNVQEMNRSRTQTLDAIESISAVSAETAACSGSVHSSAGSQLDAIKDLDRAAQDLRERADRLTGALASFSV